MHCTTYAQLLVQEKTLLQMRKTFQTKKPYFANVLPMMDTTGERVTLSVGRSAVKATWHVFVLRYEFIWGFEDSDVCESFTPIVPPMPVSNTGAASAWDAVENHPFVLHLNEFRNELLNVCDLPMKVGMEDQASGNVKLTSHEEVTHPPKWWQTKLPCFNHQNFIAHNYTMLGVCGTKPLLDMYTCSMFMNAGTHLLRSSMCVKPVVEKTMVLRNGFPPQSAIDFANEMIQLQLQWRTKHKSKNASKKNHRRVQARESAFEVSLRRLFQNIGGGYEFGSEAIIVYIGDATKTPELFKEKVDIISEDMRIVMFSTVFCAPSCSKWTKNGLGRNQKRRQKIKQASQTSKSRNNKTKEQQQDRTDE